MGAWDSGPFENDTSMDWVRELGESEDPGYPLAVLRKLDGAGPLACHAAELALRVVDAIEGDSELQLLWDEGDGSLWHAGIADLRRRLRAQGRDVSLPPRRAEVRYRPGDVAQLLTSTGQVAYIQLIGRTDAPAFDLIRVLPGLFSPPLSEGSLWCLALARDRSR